MLKYLLISSLLIITLHSHAQFLRADYKKAELMYHRPVVVALFDLALAEDRCDSIHMSWYNDQIREVMPDHWGLNDSIIYMERRRLASIIGSRSPEYAVLTAKPSMEGQQSSNDIYWSRSFTFMLFLSEDGMRLDQDMVDRNSPIIPDTDVSGQLLRGRYIFKLSFANDQLSVNDLVFAIQQFNDRVQLALNRKYSKKGLYAQKIPKETSATLTTKTLLIPDNLDPDGIDEKIILKYYKHPFLIASQEEIEAKITAKDENFAYLHYLWSDAERMFMTTVIDVRSGNLLAAIKAGKLESLTDNECLPAGISYRSMLRLKAIKLKTLNRLVN